MPKSGVTSPKSRPAARAACTAFICSSPGTTIKRTATVSFGGIAKEVSLALVPDATVGDYVIVHVGFAISKLDEEAARRTLELMAQLDRGEARGQGR